MEKTEMILNLEHARRYAEKFVMWAMNYGDYTIWMHKVFDEVGLGDHLLGKWEQYLDDYGVTGGPFIFYLSLDDDNRDRLIKYIFEEYKGHTL